MSLCCSYIPDYFSIADILATEERVTCMIEITLPGLGFLDVSSETDDLKEGSKVELPLWLALPLNTLRLPIVSIDIPNIYKESYREILQADACAVPLNKWNPFYYEVGMYLRHFNNSDYERITVSLLETFISRFKLVRDLSQNASPEITFASQLPMLERELFEVSKKAKLQLMDWLKKGSGIIKTSKSAANIRKRKRTDYDLH